MARDPRSITESFRVRAEETIRAAQEQGAFDNLPGQGQPLADLDGQYDPMWWVKKWIKRQQVQVTPPELRVRREIEQELEQIMTLRTEAAVRGRLARLNQRIRQVNAMHVRGPTNTLTTLDEEKVVARWRYAQSEGEA